MKDDVQSFHRLKERFFHLEREAYSLCSSSPRATETAERKRRCIPMLPDGFALEKAAPYAYNIIQWYTLWRAHDETEI